MYRILLCCVLIATCIVGCRDRKNDLTNTASTTANDLSSLTRRLHGKSTGEAARALSSNDKAYFDSYVATAIRAFEMGKIPDSNGLPPSEPQMDVNTVRSDAQNGSRDALADFAADRVTLELLSSVLNWSNVTPTRGSVRLHGHVLMFESKSFSARILFERQGKSLFASDRNITITVGKLSPSADQAIGLGLLLPPGERIVFATKWTDEGDTTKP